VVAVDGVPVLPCGHFPGYALDAAFVDAFGFANSLIGFVVAAAVTLPLTLVIAFGIARKHVDIDLLTRGSGWLSRFHADLTRVRDVHVDLSRLRGRDHGAGGDRADSAGHPPVLRRGVR
jgi:hypothetical protein